MNNTTFAAVTVSVVAAVAAGRYRTHRRSVAARAVIDTTDDDTIAASVRGLDGGLRFRIMRALVDAQSADNDNALLEEVRDILAEDRPGCEAVAVLFTTTSYDNGYFLDPGSADVLFADGTIESGMDFGEGVNKTLTAEFGIRGPEFSVVLNLRTGDLDEEDSSWGSTRERFAGAHPPIAATSAAEGAATA